MRMYDVILKKRNGEKLTDEEIRFFVEGYTNGSIPDYQASALCMAIFYQGLTDEETSCLTDAMAHSGDTLDLSRFGDLSVDKHSTGGVGDKTSLMIGPIMASLGAKMAKMSGRGLGHTGGTVDKLESIPGLNIALTEDAFLSQVEEMGLAIIGQTGNLTPADKKLYALRDVTATVDAIPLIVSSIMSKKLAAGSKTIVLDVKVGTGAFMKDLQSAEVLATKMVEIGRMNGRRMAAVLTDMNVPLGYQVGNAMEVKEAISVLKGESVPDLRYVVETLASNMASLAFEIPFEEALTRVKDAIDSGKALETMRNWVKAQGGDSSYIDHPEKFPVASVRYEVKAPSSGYIARMDAESIGIASVILGAGRASKEDSIDYSAGITILKKSGDEVKEGEPIAVLYTNNASSVLDAEKKYLEAVSVQAEKPEVLPLVYKVIR